MSFLYVNKKMCMQSGDKICSHCTYYKHRTYVICDEPYCIYKFSIKNWIRSISLTYKYRSPYDRFPCCKKRGDV